MGSAGNAATCYVVFVNFSAEQCGSVVVHMDGRSMSRAEKDNTSAALSATTFIGSH